MKWILALPVLLVALVFAAGVPKASAYYLANGCDIYNEYNGKIYRCTPDRTTFYTPDGLNPNWIYPGTEGKISIDDFGGDVGVIDNIGIPPPAPFNLGKDYCSNPELIPSAFEANFQQSCYYHDVCYGSQLGRQYCDVRFWQDMVLACQRMWAPPIVKDWCISEADAWYMAVRVFGASHYKPRRTSFEP